MRYYKFIDHNNCGEYSGFDFSKYLPKGDEPGEWLPNVRNLKICKSGYHACAAKDLSKWIHANLYEVEYSSTPEWYEDKVVGHQIRFVRRINTWNARTARLFSVWCARETIKRIPSSPNRIFAMACNVAERYANGEATKEELRACHDVIHIVCGDSWAVQMSVSAAINFDDFFAAFWSAHWSAHQGNYEESLACEHRQFKKLMEMLEI